MGINPVLVIDDLVPLQFGLFSLADKTDLPKFILELLKIVPNFDVISTGGTYSVLEEVLGDLAKKRLQQVSVYTGQPETDGGLVKTLDFKIYLGLLTDKYNPLHQADLRRNDARAIDLFVGSFYPFEDVIAQDNVTFERARGNIDIGGPCMWRATMKNCLRVLGLGDPDDFEDVLQVVSDNNGCSTLDLRCKLAQKAWEKTGKYDMEIHQFMSSIDSGEVANNYDVRNSSLNG